MSGMRLDRQSKKTHKKQIDISFLAQKPQTFPIFQKQTSALMWITPLALLLLGGKQN